MSLTAAFVLLALAKPKPFDPVTYWPVVTVTDLGRKANFSAVHNNGTTLVTTSHSTGLVTKFYWWGPMGANLDLMGHDMPGYWETTIAVTGGILRSSSDCRPCTFTDASTMTTTPGVYCKIAGTGIINWVEVVDADKVSITTTFTDNATSTPQYHSWEPLFESGEIACTDASIDSRLAFGQPNYEGQVTADPNAEPRNVNFGSWIFKGGLFAGVMSPITQDQSGIGRIQLWANSAVPSDPDFESVSLIDLGSPSKAPDSLELGGYAPTAVGSETETNATWANRWTISIGSPQATKTFTSSTANPDFANFGLTSVVRDTGQTPNVMVVTTPTSALSRAVIAETGEASGGAKWRYFASREYGALGVMPSPFTSLVPKFLWIKQNGDIPDTVSLSSW